MTATATAFAPFTYDPATGTISGTPTEPTKPFKATPIGKVVTSTVAIPVIVAKEVGSTLASIPAWVADKWRNRQASFVYTTFRDALVITGAVMVAYVVVVGAVIGILVLCGL